MLKKNCIKQINWSPKKKKKKLIQTYTLLVTYWSDSEARALRVLDHWQNLVVGSWNPP